MNHPQYPNAPQQQGYPQQQGFPQGGYPGGQMQPQHPNATTVLILGLIGLFFFPLLAPIAWFIGGKARKEVKAGIYAAGGGLTAGYIMGVIGTIFLILGFVFVMFLVFVLGGALFGLAAVGGTAAAIDQQVAEARTEMESIYREVQSFQAENRMVPRSLNALTLSRELQTDPWGNPYEIRTTSNGKFEIVSLGSDGRPGGMGSFDDDDITYPSSSSRGSR